MYLNFEKEMDPRNLRHIKFSDPKVHEKYIKYKLAKCRENWNYLKLPLQFLCTIVFAVEFLYNRLETTEHQISCIGAFVLFSGVEFFYRTVKKFDFIARYSGIVMFVSFSVYMAEITASNKYYKLYEGFLVLGSVEFLMSITLTVDIWLCPFAVFLSHTYAFLRIYCAFDSVSDVLCPGLYVPLFHFTMSCHLFNIHSKKDFLFSEMQKEMIQRFLTILKTFPERIIISQKNAFGEIDYAFTNDEMTEESLLKGNGDTVNESILMRDEEMDLFGDENTQDLQDALPLDVFLEEERNKTLEEESLISEWKITSVTPFHSKLAEKDKKLDLAEEGKEKMSRRHYTVKTRQIEWRQEHSEWTQPYIDRQGDTH